MNSLQQANALSDETRQVLLACKSILREFLPNATVLVYGSVARGDAEPESDYDILVLTDRQLSSADEERVGDALYNLELERGVVLSVLFYARPVWDDPMHCVMPLHRQVEREGIVLYTNSRQLRKGEEESHAEAAEKTGEVAEKRSEDRSPRSSTGFLRFLHPWVRFAIRGIHVFFDFGSGSSRDVKPEEAAYVRHRLTRAREAIAEAKLLAHAGHLLTAVNRLYYACFYCSPQTPKWSETNDVAHKVVSRARVRASDLPFEETSDGR